MVGKPPMVSLRDDPFLKSVPEIDGFKVLEPCVLYSKLGEGGMGAVYRGRHLNLDIDVAVKCLRGSLADQGSQFVQRFQREARLAAGIHHQNLVQVYDVSQKSGVHYLVMEFVNGETARGRVERKLKLGIDEALRIALGAATGLGEAHARKIIHRDVKPDNVLIGRDGSVKVSDLGLAKALESEVDVALTQGVMGTPQYMAPEQWEDSSSVTPAADVWALGATIWFLLAGTDPIKRGTMKQVYKSICVEPFPDIRSVRPEVREEVAHLIARCTAREVSERFADCREVQAALRSFVGVDRGELVSSGGETTRTGMALVSPPPPGTMASIRSKVESRTNFRPELQTPPLPIELDATRPMEEPWRASAPPSRVSWTKRARLPVAIGAGAIVLALAVFLALRAGKPAPLPPDTLAMRVGFDGIAAPNTGYESAVRRFSLVGTIEGKDTGLRTKLREKGGTVALQSQGPGRFRVDFDFDRDGTYTLELDGTRLEGARTLALTIDATKPALLKTVEDPNPPLPRDQSVTLSLEFNEALKSGEIAGKAAVIHGNVAEVSVRTPAKGDSWTVAWKVVDKLGNESTNSFRRALRPEPEPEQPKPVEKLLEPTDAGATVAHSEPQPPVDSPARDDPPIPKPSSAQAPLGCTPQGDETVEIAGRRWPKRIVHTASSIQFVLIQPGKFMMGSNQLADDATAPRSVTLTRGFYIAEDEVSEAEYARVLKLSAPQGATRMPVPNLSCDLASRFCAAAGLELPTEAEWEYACRANSDAAFAFGDTLSPRQGVTLTSSGKLQRCGYSQRNDFGLADMHGNLREYCADGYLTPADYARLSDRDPVGKKGKDAVLRGGSYVTQPELCASATRRKVDRKKAVLDAGVRPILHLP